MNALRHAVKVWQTAYRCQRCKEVWLHIETSDDDDEAHGLPDDLRWCDCGGKLVKQHG
jgi:hypothetical protein